MAYKLSVQAEDDFSGIYDYTLQQFGERQADHYTSALAAFLDALSGMPALGRYYPAVPGIMRIEFQRHTLFYTVRTADIFIVRILHQQMNLSRHFM